MECSMGPWIECSIGGMLDGTCDGTGRSMGTAARTSGLRSAVTARPRRGRPTSAAVASASPRQHAWQSAPSHSSAPSLSIASGRQVLAAPASSRAVRAAKAIGPSPACTSTSWRTSRGSMSRCGLRGAVSSGAGGWTLPRSLGCTLPRSTGMSMRSRMRTRMRRSMGMSKSTGMASTNMSTSMLGLRARARVRAFACLHVHSCACMCAHDRALIARRRGRGRTRRDESCSRRCMNGSRRWHACIAVTVDPSWATPRVKLNSSVCGSHLTSMKTFPPKLCFQRASPGPGLTSFF